ncbi:MAG: helix-turn-helix transcriptional regulator [Saprospiraceae bacterium]|jgi:transcriptional regulator with XRE-family HTH domain|nr:helix-turn-helix transcriptional regulator [Saprospiraceae bacterium]
MQTSSSNQFGSKIRQLRENNKLLLRHLAPLLDMDTPHLSKIERGERLAKKNLIPIFAKVLNASQDELFTLWLADQIVDVVKDSNLALDAMMVAEASVKYQIKQKVKE